MAAKESCEVTNGIRTHDLRDIGVMLYRLSYEASPEAGQMRVQFIPVIWLHSSVGRASHRYRGRHGFESRWSLGIFSGLYL